jgi:hypothetical protein
MTDNPFDFLDFTEAEALEADRKLLSKPAERDGRICICGHPVGRHTNIAGIVLCKPTRMECPCKSVRPVLECDDVRPFLRKTSGSGAMHALGRGIAAAHERGKNVAWLVEMKCDRCQKDGRLSPVPVTKQGVASNEATGYDALLCAECRLEV